MGRRSCCSEEKGVRKGPWSGEEDEKLAAYIKRHGHQSWKALPELAGLNRCGKSCRLRWMNYLRPEIKRGSFSPEEEELIIRLHSQHGNRWSRIAGHLPGRTDNEIKNFWNTRLKKKLIRDGIDPNTHMPIPTDPNDHLLAQLLSSPNNSLCNPMATWEIIATELKLQLLQNLMQAARSTVPPVPTLSIADNNALIDNNFLVGSYLLADQIASELQNYPTRGNPSNVYEPSQTMMISSSANFEGNYSGLQLPALSSVENISETSVMGTPAYMEKQERDMAESTSTESSTITIFEDLDKLMELDDTFSRETILY